MRTIATIAALSLCAGASGQTFPTWPQGLLGVICSENAHVDAETGGTGFCVQTTEAQRRQLNRMMVLNRMAGGGDRVWFDFRNKPDVFYEVGPNPAGWKVSIDELDVGTAVTYMKRADNRPDDPVVGVERARLTMAVFKTSSPVLHLLRSEANEDRRWWKPDIPIQYTWDRPSAYREGSAYSVAVYYASASPVSTLSADPIKSTRINFSHGGV